LDLLSLLREFVFRYPGLRQAQGVGVAVSGGGDSVALACLAREVLGRITLLHMNYGLRGIESDLDEALVRELAGRLDCPLIVERVRPEGRSEEELRELRYAWFGKCDVDVILTGHTREDQAETVLFRLVRGTGVSGLAAIQPVLNGRIYRPLLEAGRQEIRNWLLKTGIPWREDVSNLDVSYRRNWIRHELLPLLQMELNPETDRALAQLAEIVREDEEWIVPHVEVKLDGMTAREGNGIVLDCELFALQPLGLRRRLMRALLERVKGNLLEIQFAHVEAALRLCEEAEGNGRIQVPGLDLMRSFGWLRVIRLEVLRNMPVRNFRMDFAIPAQIEVPEGAGTVVSSIDRGCNYNESGKSLDWEKVLAASDENHSLELRNWRPGDGYMRAGSSHPEKVKELFQKYRIPLWRRRAWPIVVLRDLPVWVAEFGPAAEFAAGPETRTALQLDWSPNREG
jgi:tRNA(Ile)-lysidine synthase